MRLVYSGLYLDWLQSRDDARAWCDYAAVCGVITGVFGGIIHDTLCNDVPLVFQRELYASVALVTAAAYLARSKLAGGGESQMVLLALFGGFYFGYW